MARLLRKRVNQPRSYGVRVVRKATRPEQLFPLLVPRQRHDRGKTRNHVKEVGI
ncbi:MAG TPA: hypothetical protein GX523_03590 [Desulfitobacterium dehalogenans]|uniref:Uncharacterized protein n=1 Tax=Desulfitobacterium dehalogenans TaxID=36854 RepID=A0A7C6Z2V8_9FIRM|nr:hypothetical protein [Desulfitobacterium dehalogenans]